MEYLTESRSDVAVDRSIVARDEINRPGESGLAANNVRFNHLYILDNLEKFPTVKLQDLVNRINYLHFTESPFYLYVERQEREDGFLIAALPDPCEGDRCTYRFSGNDTSEFDEYTLRFLFVPCDRYFLIAPTQRQRVQAKTSSIKLSDKVYKVNQRENRRYPCLGLSVSITQNRFHAKGKLVDFSPMGLNIVIDHESCSAMRWFNEGRAVHLQLKDAHRLVFASPCICVRREARGSTKQHLVLSPGNQRREEHCTDEMTMRNPRQQLCPSFSISFRHPLMGKRVRMQIHDITTSGFSVVEPIEECLLIPGSILTEVTIHYAGVFKFECREARVIYRSLSEGNHVRCGVAILDMDLQNYTKLANILTKAIDPHAEISCEVDMDDLWDFFFYSGFIYPQKYKSIQADRHEFKATYEKLYKESSAEIVRHFTYQNHGRIYGHISLIRAYEKSWMFHHLSAKSMEGRRPGPHIIKQITHFIHDLYRFPSAQMDYYMCYYQPRNRFSSLLFGGYAKQQENPKVCSQDRFTYFIRSKDLCPGDLPQCWVLDRFTTQDGAALRGFYDRFSGGMALDALQLEAIAANRSTVVSAYRRCGFTRNIEVFSLRRQNELYAVMLVNQTEFGLNLSNLLNCVKVIVCKPEALSWGILEAALDQLVRRYSSDNIPVLLYPSTYFDFCTRTYSAKDYFLWVIDARHMGDFMVTTKQKTKIGYWE